jgi:hypothetical protein
MSVPSDGLACRWTSRDEGAAFAREHGPLSAAPHWNGGDGDLAPSAVPYVDHRPLQTPIRNQGDRSACLSFASLACLEAILLEHFGKEVDLSEQFLQFVLTGDHCAEAVDLRAAPEKLAGRGVCEESLAPYELRATASLHRSRPPSPDAFRRAFYKIGRFHLLENRGLAGPSVRNTDYLEALLRAGHDVVTALRIAAGIRGGDGILDVRYDASGEPLHGNGAHALLLVGYDRRDPSRPHFLFKDSLGVSRSGRDGYHRLSYDYVRAYALSGFLVESLEIAGPPFGPMAVKVHGGSCCEAFH